MTSVEAWVDFACPWCYLGKRRLERAAAAAATPVQVRWRSFQLNPSVPRFGAPGAGEPVERYLAAKLGGPERARQAQQQVTAAAAADGLEYRLDLTRHVNTLDAHRLLQEGRLQGRADAVAERLFAAHFTEGLRIDDPEVLARLAAEADLDPERAAAVVGSEEHLDAVAEDIETAAQIGVAGVPFFLLDRRLAVSGAQRTELLAQAIEQAGTAGSNGSDGTRTRDLRRDRPAL